MNELIELLKHRRSCRFFTDQPVDKETLDQILEAGIYAPSGENKQETKILVIQDRETIHNLSVISGVFDGNMVSDAFYQAQTILLVVSDSSSHTFVEDGSLVMGNLMNAAHALGLGSCWIHWAREALFTPYGRKLCKKWNLPEEYVGIAFCAIGYPQKRQENLPRRKEGRIIFVEEQGGN